MNTYGLTETMFINREQYLEAIIQKSQEELRPTLIRFCDSIRDYEKESGNKICNDERESEEFADIFLKGKNN